MSKTTATRLSVRTRILATAAVIPLAVAAVLAVDHGGEPAAARDRASSAASVTPTTDHGPASAAPASLAEAPANPGHPGSGGKIRISVGTSTGATASTTISCDGDLHTIDRFVTLGSQSRFSSQSGAFRSYVYRYATGTGFWTDWTAMTAPGGMDTFTNLPWDFGTNSYALYMQYAWYDGASWSFAGEWMGSYIEKVEFGATTESYCTA